MRRLQVVFASLACLPFLSGCFPYLYPRLHRTPSVRLSQPTDDVHAFRVKIGRYTADLMRTESEALCEVPVNHREVVRSQVWPAYAIGVTIVGPLTFVVEGSTTMNLRIYRPGYELIERQSWEQQQEVVWQPATTIDEQIAVLDRLFPPNPATFAELPRPTRILVRGSNSKAHRDALLFGASEYERLAMTAETDDQHTQLLERAAWLKQRAAD